MSISLNKEDLRNNVIANFRFIRKQLNISTRELGERLGLPQKTIGAIEEGRSAAEYNVYKLSLYTGITMDILYTTRLNGGPDNL